MKAVILAGGFGTRLAEETHLRPKPMVEIGGYPILFHLMNYLAKFEINDFVICCGYKSEHIKDYFLNFYARNSDINIDLSTGHVSMLNSFGKSWKVSIIDTGLEAMTGGRLLSVAKYLDDQPFLFTYGDGLCDVDITLLKKSHYESKKLATVTAVLPPGRFGALSIGDDNAVSEFAEKPKGDGSRINGGFFILDPKVLSFIAHSGISWENEPLKMLVQQQQLNAFIHDGNWLAMDTLRDKQQLEKLWNNNSHFW